MKVYVILESYTDYKGGNATSFGVFRTKESAIKNLPLAVAERFGYADIEEVETEWGIKFDDYYTNEKKTHWYWDRGDDLVEFYVQEDDLYEE